MADDVVALADYSVEIDGETHHLTQVPGPTSKLVDAQKKEILADLNLNDLVAGLKRSASLLFLAFNGVAGNGELRRDTNALQDKLGHLCGATSIALDSFHRWSLEVLGTIKDVFTYLVDGDEAIAIELLKDSSATAAKMATEANKLATRFDALADETMTVSGKTQVAQAQSDEQKRKFEEQQTDLKAKNENAKTLSDNLAKSRTKLDALYTEAKSKADTAAERGFAVQMVGAILGPIAQGLGAIGGAFVAAKTGGAQTPPPAPKADSSEEAAAKKKLDEETAKKETAEKEVAAAKAEKEKADTAKTDAIKAATQKETVATLAKEKADKTPDDPALKEAAEKAKTEAATAKTAKEAAENALTEATEKFDQKQKTLRAIGESIMSAQTAFETAAKNLVTVGAGLLDLAQSYEEEKQGYLKLMLQYQEQEAKALASIAEYAVRMAAVTDYIAVQRTASESLLQAIKAFNTVAQILRDAAKFWTQMKYACDELANPTVQRRVELFSQQPAEKKAAEWKNDRFKTMAVNYMAKWQALHLVCVEYSEAASGTRKEIQANIILSPTPEESLKLVPGLAQTLSNDATRAKEAAMEKTRAIEQAIKETPTAA